MRQQKKPSPQPLCQTPHVSRIQTAPVKSASLSYPKQLQVTLSGSIGDRDFLFCGAQKKFVSCSPNGKAMAIQSSYDLTTGELTLRFPDGTEVKGNRNEAGEDVTMNFFDRRVVTGKLMPERFTAALSKYFGEKVDLVRKSPGQIANDGVISMVSAAAIRDLTEQNSKLTEPLKRFRMTLEIDGIQALEEESWVGRRVRVGTAIIKPYEAAERCQATTREPRTGEVTFNTLMALTKYRGKDEKGKINFGVYCTVEQEGVINVGDSVEALDD